MEKRIVVTPEVFFDLFILCLYWQWNEGSLATMFTTVDKVARILSGLKVLTEKQKKVGYKDRRLQSLFSMKARIINTGTSRDSVLLDGKLLCVLVEASRDLSREKMLRNNRMYLTQRGAEYARTVEKKYLPYIDKEKYVFEVSRQELQLRSSGKAAVYKNYMQKVEGETE